MLTYDVAPQEDIEPMPSNPGNGCDPNQKPKDQSHTASKVIDAGILPVKSVLPEPARESQFSRGESSFGRAYDCSQQWAG